MILKAYYAGGRIDVFDTDHMIDCVPQPQNLLTNYTLDLADVNGESLWIRSFYYEAAQGYRDELGPKELPVARRRDGWSFLVADADDLQALIRLTADGETVLVQMAGELVDAAALSWAYDVAVEYSQMIGIAHNFFTALHSGDEEAVEGSMCSRIGVPRRIIEQFAHLTDEQAMEKSRF